MLDHSKDKERNLPEWKNNLAFLNRHHIRDIVSRHLVNVSGGPGKGEIVKYDIAHLIGIHFLQAKLKL